MFLFVSWKTKTGRVAFGGVGFFLAKGEGGVGVVQPRTAAGPCCLFCGRILPSKTRVYAKAWC